MRTRSAGEDETAEIDKKPSQICSLEDQTKAADAEEKPKIKSRDAPGRKHSRFDKGASNGEELAPSRNPRARENFEKKGGEHGEKESPAKPD